MSGPDPKRMYLAINSQNVENLKAEKPYWSKPFVFLNPTGSGPKYTAFQAAMLLQKMKAVEFLLDQPSVDMTVKSTDGKNSLITAVEAKMSVAIMEKILQKVELRSLFELDSFGKGVLDYAEPGTEMYEFLHSMGCKNRAEREALMAGFFAENVKGTVPGVSAHQRRRKGANTPRKKGGKKGSGSSTNRSDNEDAGKSPQQSEAPTVEEEESTTWKAYANIDDLEAALKEYVHQWGEDHEEGQSCAHWLKSISRARENGKTEKVLSKWNANVEHSNEKNSDAGGDAKSKSHRGRSSNRSNSPKCSGSAPTTHRGRSAGSNSIVDREAVKLFFSGKAEDQVNLKNKGKHAHRLTFVVEKRSASAGPPVKHSENSGTKEL